MDFNFCAPNFRTWRWTSDTWHAIQLSYSEQSCNRSPWEKAHKSQMVKPNLMKLMVLDQGHARLPQCKISDIEEQQFQRYHRNSNRHFCRINWKIRASYFGSFPPLFSEKGSTLDRSPWGGVSFYPIRSERFQVLKIRVSMTNPRSTISETRTNTSNQ